jgi:hypothetical protein
MLTVSEHIAIVQRKQAITAPTLCWSESELADAHAEIERLRRRTRRCGRRSVGGGVSGVASVVENSLHIWFDADVGAMLRDFWVELVANVSGGGVAGAVFGAAWAGGHGIVIGVALGAGTQAVRTVVAFPIRRVLGRREGRRG